MPQEVHKKPLSDNTSSSGCSGGLSSQESSKRYTSRSMPDTYQLFVGGLPSNTTDQELRSVFEQYGYILEIRINPHNFAFVVFDSEKPVNAIFDNEPPKIRGKQLTIEKQRPKPSDDVCGMHFGFQQGGSSGSGQRGGGLHSAPKTSKW